jgi:hypothetical protein
VFRIEQAIKRSKTQKGTLIDEQEVFRLQSILNQAREVLAVQPAGDSLQSFSMQDALSHPTGPPSSRTDQLRQSLSGSRNSVSDDNYALDDAENPLQLLAKASDLITPSVPPPHSSSIASSTVSQPIRQDLHRKDDLQAFFGPFRPSLDIGEDVDPIDLGLVSLEEADDLFN